MRYLPIVLIACGTSTGSGGMTGMAELALAGSPGELAFADTHIGDEAVLSVDVTNTGDAPSGALVATIVGEDAFTITTDSDCVDLSLAPGATCHVGARFAPMGLGHHAAKLRMTASPGGTLEVPLTGAGLPELLPMIEIQFAGGKGDVRIRHGDKTFFCTATCMVPATYGAYLQMDAVSPSGVVGWSGACTSATESCDFAFDGTGPAVITFAKLPSEEATVLVPSAPAIRSIDYDSMNRLVIATTQGVTALDASFMPRWTVTTITDPHDATKTLPAVGRIRLDPADNVILLTKSTLAKLAPDGTFLWSVDLGADIETYLEDMQQPFAAGANGDIAIQVRQTLKVFSPQGQLRWSTTVLPAVGGVAFDSAGNVVTLVERDGAPDNLTVARFTAAGAPLPAPSYLVSEYHAVLALDPADNYVTIASGHERLWIQKTATDGTSFNFNVFPVGAPYADNGVHVSASGEIFTVYPPRDNFIDGYLLERRSPAGMVTFSAAGVISYVDTDTMGPIIHDMAIDHTGRVAVAGEMYGFQWESLIQVFAP